MRQVDTWTPRAGAAISHDLARSRAISRDLAHTSGGSCDLVNIETIEIRTCASSSRLLSRPMCTTIVRHGRAERGIGSDGVVGNSVGARACGASERPLSRLLSWRVAWEYIAWRDEPAGGGHGAIVCTWGRYASRGSAARAAGRVLTGSPGAA